jgi:NAD(P)H-hydrate epimerase
MIGAPALVANAGLRSGAGLATVACPRSIQLAVATLCPCATTIPLPENAAGMLDPRRSLRLLRGLGLLGGDMAPSVVAAGPGLSRGNEGFDRAWLALLAAFGEAGMPLVVDADGLNAMHRSSVWKGPGGDETPHFGTIITPHPGEMAGLHGVTAATVQADRRGFAVRTAALMSAGSDDPDHRAVVVLKGAGTLVTDGVKIYRNKTGNPGMATGGSGDVLTGVIAALIAQGLNTLDAAVLGVQVHGLAGDLAAKDLGEAGLIATDLIDYLLAAFKQPRRS